MRFKARLTELRVEMDEIYAAFPSLRPRPSSRRRGHRSYYREGLHWTQRPENRERVKDMLTRMHEGARRKFGIAA